MRFLIHNQLLAAMAGAFQAAGFEAMHVLDSGLDGAPDSEIIRYAARHRFVIVTKDEDSAF
jgi:predicted nuclease of predicted toxin-antitoxin system